MILGDKYHLSPLPVSNLNYYTRLQTLAMNIVATFTASSIYCDVNMGGIELSSPSYFELVPINDRRRVSSPPDAKVEVTVYKLIGL